MRLPTRAALAGCAAGCCALAGCDGQQYAPERPSPHPRPSQSYWLAGLPPADSSAQLPAEVDVAVVGSGISGASAAFFLGAAGRRVLVLEARDQTSGATGRNGGFVHARGWEELPHLAWSRGPLLAYRLVRFEHECQDQLRRLVEDHNIDCGYERQVQAVQLYETEAAMAAELGWIGSLRALRPLLSWCGVQVLDAEQCREQFGCTAASPVVGAVATRGSCDMVWSAKLARGVMDLAQRTGNVQLLTNCPVYCEDQNERGKIVLNTSLGPVKCEHVVYATNAYTAQLLPEYSGRIVPVLNYVAQFGAGSPPLYESPVGMSTSPGWNYWIQTRDRTVICGGFRNRRPDRGFNISDDSLEPGAEPLSPDAVGAMAQAFMADRFEGFRSVPVERVWSGVIGWSCDGLPWVGPVEGRPNRWVCAGFSGHGMTQAFLCGRAVAEMIQDGQPPSWLPAEFLPKEQRYDKLNAFKEEREGGV